MDEEDLWGRGLLSEHLGQIGIDEAPASNRAPPDARVLSAFRAAPRPKMQRDFDAPRSSTVTPECLEP